MSNFFLERSIQQKEKIKKNYSYFYKENYSKIYLWNCKRKSNQIYIELFNANILDCYLVGRGS